MRKLIVCAVLLAGMAASFAVMDSASHAQGTKKDKTTKGKGGPVIEITEGRDGRFRFFIRNSDGKLLAMSSPPRGFASEKEATKAVEELRAAVKSAKVTVGKSKKKKGE